MASVHKDLLLENSGQGLIEYSLILFLIVVAVMVVLQTCGEKVLDLYKYTLTGWLN